MATPPTAAPVALGWNCTFSMMRWPGFSVTGNDEPDTEKSAPVTVAAVTVTGTTPVHCKATDRVASEFTGVFPNARLVGLMPSNGTAGFIHKTKTFEAPL